MRDISFFLAKIMLVAFNIRFCSVEFILFLYFFFLSVCLSLCLSSLRPRRPVVKSAVWSKSQRTFFYFLWTLISFICKQNQGNLLTNKNTFLIPRKWHHFLFCLLFYCSRQPLPNCMIRVENNICKVLLKKKDKSNLIVNCIQLTLNVK